MPLANEVKRLRAAAALTQKQLADLVGVNQSFIGQLETGRSTGLNAETLFKLAAALQVDCSHFAPFFADAEASAAGAVTAPVVKPEQVPVKGKKTKKK